VSGEVRVARLGKSYRDWGSEWRRIASWFVPSVCPRQEKWRLKDVSFSLPPGEAVGIIGQNGSGKSTLLKLIAGTTRPTEGTVSVIGRVAAILELGMGFNPELTGRQNATHSAGLMGFSRAEIHDAMADIEAFSEIGEYFDLPVRVYSSGMQVRVAFAVATAFQPDILIIDEALSVGDSYFQHKSFERIRSFKSQGVSIMFVTHNMADVRALCDKVLLLDGGRVVKEGLPDEVIDYYNALIAARENSQLNVEQRRQKDGWSLTRSGTGAARVTMMGLFDVSSGAELAIAKVGQAVELRLEAVIHEPLPRLVLGYMIRDKQGQVVWGTNTWHTGQLQTGLRPGEKVIYRLRFTCTLGPGSYSVSPALVSSDTHLVDNYDWVDNMFIFDVVNSDRASFIGTNWLDAKFSINRASEELAQ
jgi:lipopolysaccharide transport system ATP-binding protein